MKSLYVLAMSLPVSLSTEERRLFQLLLDTVHHFNLNGTCVRVAGGWVRDKLLGKNSNDIDIVLNNHTGRVFAEYVNEYLKLQKQETHRIGVILANPEQSKHLETAKVHIFGHEVDFVNLRAESYGSDSHRIPAIVRFGSPLEDAERRDFTINALFYNVNESKVEDFTEMGLKDLHDKLIRTPLNPLETFKDDPLRVLRAIRFASRLEFDVHEEIVSAARNSETKLALANKVSRERVGHEFEKMILVKDERKLLRSLDLIQDFEVGDVVFRVPLDYLQLPPDPESNRIKWEFAGYEESCAWLGPALKTTKKLFKVHGTLVSGSRVVATCSSLEKVFCGLLFCLHGREIRNFKGKYEPIEIVILRDSLKMNNLISKNTLILTQCATEFGVILSKEYKNINDKKVALGRLIRKAKDMWVLALSLHTASCLSDNYHSSNTSITSDDEIIIRRAQVLIQEIEYFELTEFYDKKPLLDGKQLMQQCGVKGPELGHLIDLGLDFQAMHPLATADDCLKYLLKTR